MKKIAYILMAAASLTMTAFGFDTTVNVPATMITSLPITISTPGKYYLASDLTAVDDVNWNISIFASNVLLDLNGQSINGDGIASGIFVDACSGVTIKNGGLANMGMAVYLFSTSDCTIDGVSATTTEDCITDYAGQGNRILNCNIANYPPETSNGIVLQDCTGDLVANNLVRGCFWGAVSGQSGGSAFRANNINCPYGLSLEPVDAYQGNLFTGNPTVTVSGGVNSTD